MRVLLLLLLLVSSCVAAQDLSCDPCIERPDYVIRAIVHGTQSDYFWLQVRAACLQAAKDMRVSFEMDLYESFEPNRMAQDIVREAKSNRLDALIVTIPSVVVQDAVEEALEYVPVFGLNSGYAVAQDLGVLGFVAMDEYQGGVAAAKQFLNRTNVTRALYVNQEKGNFALEQRLDGFRDTLLNSTDNTAVVVDEVVVDGSNATVTEAELTSILDGCPYDAILLSGGRPLEPATGALYANGCLLSENLLGSFDTNAKIYDAIAVGKLAFTISQQQHLQGALSVVMASIYVSTGKKLARSEESDFGIYFSGPAVIHIQNLPSDTLQTCEADSFPVCPNTLGPDGTTPSKCDCIDRSLIKIGGVLHGETTDLFWDVIFAQAQQAAQDFKIDLKLDRLEPEASTEILHAKMAQKMISLCQEGVHGLFVTIPSELVIPAIQQCQALNIPVLSINAGAQEAIELNLVHHIAMVEYSAGYGAGQRLVANGMLEGACLSHVDLFLLEERCRGFQDAIRETGGNVTYLGKVDVPPDNVALFQKEVEEAVGTGGDWDGIGLLLGGATLVNAALVLKESHPNVLLGSFDTSDEMYSAFDENLILFGIDQVPFMQGYMPVPLLTWLAYTKQRLININIETGPSFVEEAPSESLQVCEANHFEVCPEPVDYDLNQLTWVRPVGLTLAAIIMATSIGFALWVVWFRNDRVVRASQPTFLVMICAGALVAGATIIPMSIDDGVASEETCSRACMAVPWLFTCGFIIMFSALFSKIHRINRVVSSANSFRRLKVTAWDVMLPFAILFSLNVIFMLVWTLVDPMYWDRIAICGSSDLSSYGVCSFGSTSVSKAMASCVAALLFLALVLANFEAYKARQISMEYSESKYVGIIMISLLQIVFIGAPLIALVYTNPPASFFVRSAVIFVLCISVLLIIFVPKIMFLRKSRRKPQSFRRSASFLSESRHSSRSILNNNETSNSTAPGRLSVQMAEETDSFIPKSNVRKLERLLWEQGVETKDLFEEAGIDPSNNLRHRRLSLQHSSGRSSESACRRPSLSHSSGRVSDSLDTEAAGASAAIDDTGFGLRHKTVSFAEVVDESE